MTRQGIWNRALLVPVTLFGVFGARDLSAAEDLEQARATFGEALVLEVAGDWAAALSKFQEVAKARLTPQVRYHLARCKEHLGRLTEALGDYRVAETEARLVSLEETGEMTRARADLEARIPRLLLRLSGIGAAIVVELDGIALGASALNQQMVVNPGWHHFSLLNSSGLTLDSFVLAEVGTLTEIDLSGYKPRLAATVDTARARPTDFDRPHPTWAYVSAGAGTVALAGSVVLWIVRNRAEGDLNEACKDGLCPARLKGVEDRGRVASVAAPIALGVGVAGVGLAVWGFLADSNRSRNQTKGTVVSAAAIPGFWGVNLAEEF